MCDQELVERILCGDQSGMHQLIVKYQDLVVNTCFQILNNQTDAEDIAQEVFIEAFRSMSSLRQQDQLSYWLYRIALNKSLNQQKKNRFLRGFLRLDHTPCPREGEPPYHQLPTGEDPFEQLLRAEKMNILRKAIASLPHRQQKAFVLHHFEQLSYKDIAQIQQISLSTVESLIFRAKTSLRKKCRMFFSE